MFSIDPNNINEELIKFIMDLNSMGAKYAQDFIYNKLPTAPHAQPIINPMGDTFMPIGDELIFSCLPGQGDAENCVFGAAKSSLLFAFTTAAFGNLETSPQLYF
jgi:hypothetical protein